MCKMIITETLACVLLSSDMHRTFAAVVTERLGLYN